MFIVYEYATCVLAASLGATMLFTGCVMLLVLIEGVRLLAQTVRKLRDGGLLPPGGGMAAESRAS